MKLHRFFIESNFLEDTSGQDIVIKDKDVIHQIKNVLRMSKSDEVIFLDNKGNECVARLNEVLKKKLIFSKENLKKISRKNEFFLKIYPALLKKDKLEYVLQKCTEIGVLEFCPLVSYRTERKNFNMKRAQKIIKESAEQSEKSYLPYINGVTSLDQLVFEYETKEVIFHETDNYYLDIDAPLINTKEIKKKLSKNQKKSNNESDNKQKNKPKPVSFFVGPEGGWSNEDRKMFNKLGVKPVSLGETVLRAETASIAVSSLLLLG